MKISNFYGIPLVFLLFFIGLSCTNRKYTKVENIDSLKQDSLKISLKNLSSYKLKDYLLNNPSLDSLTNFILSKLTDAEKVSQMIISSAGKFGKDKNTLDNLIKTKIIGGVVFLGSDKSEIKKFTEHYISKADSLKILPLMFSTDAEPTLINRKIFGLPQFKTTSDIKNITQCAAVTDSICKVLVYLNINQNYAPVCDLNVNKEIISDRSFSNKDSVVISLASTFLRSSQLDNIISTAKHFPGHGYAKGDSHKELVFINGDLKELNIFKNMIDSGVISIMVGHIVVNDNEKYSTNGLPSSISPKMIKNVLRDELGFKGLIITDAMNMNAIKKFNSPAFQASLAGCDLILMPTDEKKLFSSMIVELNKNPEYRKQVNESVFRILKAKICLGLFNKLNSNYDFN